MILRTLLAVSALASAALVSGGGGAGGATTQLLPDLEPQRASSIRIESKLGQRLLRFSATSWNSGSGPLEIIGGATDSGTQKQRVDQRVYNSDGTYSDTFAGHVDWHETHQHIHFNDYAVYTLDSVTAPGSSLRTSSKTTFCILDTVRVRKGGGSVPRQPAYATCGSQVQGLSVGWGDTYGYWLPGQEIDITTLPDGDYTLTIEIDPKDWLAEQSDTNNTSTVRLRISGTAVTVLDGGKGKSR